MIYLASDHGGFELKTKIEQYLKSKDFHVEDMGPKTYNQKDDYPDYVIPVMRKVQEDPHSKAILLCRNGVGVSMLANKFRGIRCALSWSTKHVKTSRADDDTNVLALPSGFLSEKQVLEIVKTWLDTPFSNKKRHKKRLRKFSQIGQ